LVDLCNVWSINDALKVQALLDRASIPFFMGPENATSVDDVTSSFVGGVSVKVMNVGLQWARQALETYAPADDPPPAADRPPSDNAIHCPQCHSADVVFMEVVETPGSESSAYRWECDACGHHWENDGTVKED
jgi:DNA-directed RNA polymerase subunit M/transcription elongation factor TFIIS